MITPDDPVAEALSKAREAGLEVEELPEGHVRWRVVDKSLKGDTILYVWGNPASVESSVKAIREFVADRSKIA
jgi:hypothetical protein